MSVRISRAALAACGSAVLAACGASNVGRPDAVSPAPQGVSDASVHAPSGVLPWIDTHAHPVGIHSACNTRACVDAVVATMDAFGVRHAILMHPPARSNASCQESVGEVVSLRPDRFFLGVGGCALNTTIQEAGGSAVSSGVRGSFAAKVESLTQGAVVFGETTALHLSYEAAHSFEETSPAAQLFKDLADIAATKKMPVDLHMDAVKQTTSTPSYFTNKSANNPVQVQGNTDPLSQLLAHNRRARWVWAHVGRDTTGDMSAALVDSLLAANPNLFIQLHPTFFPLKSTNAIVADATFAIRADWLDLLKKYPDRAVLGSDVFFSGTKSDSKPLNAIQLFLQGLPRDLASKIGCENPVTIYRLPSGC